jgi:NAD(P)-dependent dehydrogenase (short-subunit alcohol dehydrogenase family)
MENYKGSGKLKNKVAIVTGGDSGIGRAVSIAFAKEGADIAIIYLNEDDDAKETKKHIEKENRKCILVRGDVGDPDFCKFAVTKIIDELGKINILVNNAGEQHPQKSILDISDKQLEKTFRTNIFSMFYMTKNVLEFLHAGDNIINTASITAFRGNRDLLDYSATKGAIVTFTKTLSLQLADMKIRVNAVAPGPVWTPLIPSTFSKEKTEKFGGNTEMKRAGQPDELAPAYVFLASDDSSFVSGQTIHVNGGEIVT